MKPEYQLQRACVQWFRENHPEWVIFGVFNEGCKQHGAFFATIGLLLGVSDLIAVTGSNVYFIEMKTPTGRQSAEQKAFQQKIESLGWKYCLVRDYDTFVKIFDEN